MKRSHSIASSFRPQLEALETRALPSSVSVAQLLPVLAQTVSQQVTQLNTQVQTMTQDFNKLKSDVASAVPFTSTFSQMIAQDYGKLSQDLGNIQALNGAIQTEATADVNFSLFLAFTGNINLNNQTDFLNFFSAYQTLTTASTQATQDLNSALGIADMNPGNSYPTLDSFLGIS